ncbi:MAG: substrate-binding domain-containing protein [Micromonosporaceae bacterium]
MTYGRPATVRSHRRGGPRRRVSFAPWLALAIVLVLVGGGLTAGYVYLIKGGCSGQATATVVVTPRIESIMQSLSQRWQETTPQVKGTCARVNVEAKESFEAAAALSGEWDPKTQGQPPDAWVPDSTAWVRRASVDADAERLVPDLQPSLARTPTVIAMPKPMAQAAGMSGEGLTWKEIIDKLNVADGWKAYQHADWGPFKVGLADPQASTAGLLALMAISDTDDSGDVDEAEQATLLDLKKVIKVEAKTTNEIINGLTSAASQSTEAALKYVSAFPALEQDVLLYNLKNPKVPLVAVYPKDGTAEADFPYLVLNASWATPQGQDVANAFMRFARGPVGKAAFQDAGFRDGNRAPGKDLTPANGVTEKITALPRAVLLPESVQHAAASWTAVTRPTNVLLVFDCSGSMGGTVRGTGKTRLDLTKAAAINALALFDDEARVGVWAFSTAQSGKDYREILALGTLGEQVGGETHRDALLRAIDNLRPGGNTGLYNTVWAAEQNVRQSFQAGAVNMVVLLTDGADDNNIAKTMTLDKLVNDLKAESADASKRIPVVTVGLGIDSNSEVLRAISNATLAPTYSSPTSFDISQVLLSALFGRA